MALVGNNIKEQLKQVAENKAAEARIVEGLNKCNAFKAGDEYNTHVMKFKTAILANPTENIVKELFTQPNFFNDQQQSFGRLSSEIGFDSTPLIANCPNMKMQDFVEPIIGTDETIKLDTYAFIQTTCSRLSFSGTSSASVYDANHDFGTIYCSQ